MSRSRDLDVTNFFKKFNIKKFSHLPASFLKFYENPRILFAHLPDNTIFNFDHVVIIEFIVKYNENNNDKIDAKSSFDKLIQIVESTLKSLRSRLYSETVIARQYIVLSLHTECE